VKLCEGEIAYLNGVSQHLHRTNLTPTEIP